MKTITYEVYNDDGSVTYETSKIVELPLFDTAEEFSEFLLTAFNDNNDLSDLPEDQLDMMNYESQFGLDGFHDHHNW
jgi:hypothetical protein